MAKLSVKVDVNRLPLLGKGGLVEVLKTLTDPRKRGRIHLPALSRWLPVRPEEPENPGKLTPTELSTPSTLSRPTFLTVCELCVDYARARFATLTGTWATPRPLASGPPAG